MFTKKDIALISPLLESQNTAVVLLDVNCSIIFANEWVTSSLNKTLDEISGLGISQCFPELSVRLDFAIKSAVEGKKSAIISERMNRTPLPLFNPHTGEQMLSQRIYVYPIEIEKGLCVKLEIVDFTSIAKREDYLRLLAEEIDESRSQLMMKSKMIVIGKMAAGVAHEINNPLAIISLQLSTLKMILGNKQIEKPEKVNSMIDICVETCDRISKIIRGLLIYGDEKEQGVVSVFSVKSVFEAARDLLSARLKQQGVTLNFDRPEYDLHILCALSDLLQILVNLIENAEYESIQHKKSEITVSARDLGKEIFISVRDESPDIPEQVVERIMDPFFTTKPLGKGAGLGLSVSLGLAKKLNATISYKSQKEHGVKEFVLAVPKYESENK